MSEFTIEHLPKSEVKITFTVTVDEAHPYIAQAVKELTIEKPIAGFRPGHATYEDVKRTYGEMRILEAALERIVRSFYVKTILDERIDTIGSPSINVDQLTPNQPIKFTIIAPVSPTVTKFPDFSACKVTVRKTNLQNTDVEKVLKDMQLMRRNEVRVDRPATNEDLVIIDLEMRKDQVLFDSGTAKDHRVYLKEEYPIVGFADKLIGIKEGEERTFSLSFPKEHFQKHLAGKDVDFSAKAKGVFELQVQELNDEFAKGIGIESMEQLREKLKENLTSEAIRKNDEAAEIELLEKLVDASAFSDIPDLLVNEEVARMMNELEHSVEDQGMKWEDYLSSLKKTRDELKLEFAAPAVRRVKTTVLIKALAKQQNIEVPEAELDKEIDSILKEVKPSDRETRERVMSPNFRDRISSLLRNRKTLAWVKRACMAI